ncbi:hypothetical protein OAW23_09345 [Flavobacteriales bacterium]|nr:hypothetical protein [Flavobacteriales bacterium]
MKLLLVVLLLFGAEHFWSQAVPAKEENIPYLVTFGNKAKSSYGDDDYAQVFFFSIPKNHKKPIYLRVYDPDIGGEIDEKAKDFNTKSRFSVYGGKGCITDKEARQTSTLGNFKSGNLLYTKTFGPDLQYDKQWVTFGPFNPSEGEYSADYFGYVFKLVCEGVSGDDGNLYKYFLSSSKDKNVPVEGGNAFTFEYTFRLHDDPKQVSHIYPYIDDKVISIKQSNFDWDSDGGIKIFSVAQWSFPLQVSENDQWVTSQYQIKKQEKGKSLDIRFSKNAAKKVRNNNVVFYVTNQYGEFLPFYTVPIGGIPKFKGSASFRQ